MWHGRNQRGSSLIEFTLVGVPLIFVLISIFEIARGMWVYETMAHALREGNRFAVVHGLDCSAHPQCVRTIGDVATVIRNNGVGLVPADVLNVRFVRGASVIPFTSLQDALADTRQWPPAGEVSAKGNLLEIQATYRFRSAIAFFWPGAGRGFTFGTLFLPASSRERIYF